VHCHRDYYPHAAKDVNAAHSAFKKSSITGVSKSRQHFTDGLRLRSAATASAMRVS
jgi:hypothetical protein